MHSRLENLKLVSIDSVRYSGEVEDSTNEERHHAFKSMQKRGTSIMTPLILGTSLTLRSTPDRMFAGPPFVTDDPEPVEFRHWEVYLGSLQMKSADGWSGTAPHLQGHIPGWPMVWSGPGRSKTGGKHMTCRLGQFSSRPGGLQPFRGGGLTARARDLLGFSLTVPGQVAKSSRT
jgi:hypothetical protein